MPTALQIITRSMRLAKVIGKGETLDSDESADGLTALNAMLDSWRIQRLFVYQILDEAFTLTAGDASYTVGSGGDFNTSRPADFPEGSFLRVNDVDFGITKIDQLAFSQIPNKSITSVPRFFYPDMAYPLITLQFDCKPDQAYSFHMKSLKTLQSFSTLTTDMALPPGYEDAVTFSLAERFGLEFGVAIDPDVKKWAGDSRKAIQRVNAYIPVMMVEPAIRGPLSILTG